jgi:O-succinylbenzoic acid--CoA ligase
MGQNLSQLLGTPWGTDWLIGVESRDFWNRLEHHCQTLQHSGDLKSLLLIVEPDPLKLLSQCLAAGLTGHSVILGNPHWGEMEWRQVQNLKPLFWPDEEARTQGWISLPQPQGSFLALAAGMERQDSSGPLLSRGELGPGSWKGHVLIPTGGSTGGLKFVVHTWYTLIASVEGFRAHFDVDRVHAYCVLPLFHVSGLMQALRVLMSAGTLALQTYKVLKQGHLLPIPEPGFLSLVPTQLQWLLDQGESYIAWLKGFRAVLLGGAPAWPGLLRQARELGIPLALTYGMTETASQVATLLPERFLAGVSSNGQALPHAQIQILGKNHEVLSPGNTGRVAISSQSLGLGYVIPEQKPQFTSLNTVQTYGLSTSPSALKSPEAEPALPLRLYGQERNDSRGFSEGVFLTDDMGFLDAVGDLHVVGRCSTKLITGGENVFPEDVEATLLTLDTIKDVCVVGLPDDYWGQRVCAVLVLSPPATPLGKIISALRPRLPPYQCPKDWILVNAIPRTAQGKVNRQESLKIAQKVLANHLTRHSVPTEGLPKSKEMDEF